MYGWYLIQTSCIYSVSVSLPFGIKLQATERSCHFFLSLHVSVRPSVHLSVRMKELEKFSMDIHKLLRSEHYWNPPVCSAVCYRPTR